jgi:hypothetical protein
MGYGTLFLLWTVAYIILHIKVTDDDIFWLEEYCDAIIYSCLAEMYL